jgi:hypothetical protein
MIAQLFASSERELCGRTDENVKLNRDDCKLQQIEKLQISRFTKCAIYFFVYLVSPASESFAILRE